MYPNRQWVQGEVTHGWVTACRLETATGASELHSVTMTKADIPFLVLLCSSTKKQKQQTNKQTPAVPGGTGL